ncbi:MAG: ABC transporter ATP-binding protein [Steroidobacteraceae bacterium]
MSAPALLQVRDLCVRHWRRAGLLQPRVSFEALRGVNLELARGEALAVVGESGSGKSTLARALFRLHMPAAGQVLLGGMDLAILSTAELRAQRRRMQMVFQDPLASLDPLQTVEQVVAEPLRVLPDPPGEREIRERVAAQLAEVGLGEEFLQRRSQRLSGGQAQRVAIARALIGDPELLVCDEPVSALDASLRIQILDLLAAEQRQRSLALLFVTHDIGSARYLCGRTAVLHQGQIVEQGATEVVLAQPQHPFTRNLLQATLSVDPAAPRGSRPARQ